MARALRLSPLLFSRHSCSVLLCDIPLKIIIFKNNFKKNYFKL